jgi:hypothetical protein
MPSPYMYNTVCTSTVQALIFVLDLFSYRIIPDTEPARSRNHLRDPDDRRHRRRSHPLANRVEADRLADHKLCNVSCQRLSLFRASRRGLATEKVLLYSGAIESQVPCTAV